MSLLISLTQVYLMDHCINIFFGHAHDSSSVRYFFASSVSY